MSWDELSEFYQAFARGRDSRNFNFGNGMLDLIQLLRSDPEIYAMQLGLSMAHMLIALPHYELQSIHIMWIADNTYEIFLTPYMDEAPDKTIVNRTDIVKELKEHIRILNKKQY